MKHFNSLLLLCLLLFTVSIQAQILNNSINYAVRTGDLYANNNWNLIGSDRIAMKIDYDYNNSGTWINGGCATFDVEGSGTIVDNHTLIADDYNRDYNTELRFRLDAWGETTTPDECNFDIVDFLRKTLISDEQGWQNRYKVTSSVGKAMEWSDDWSNQFNNWVYADPNYDCQLESIWRYSAGDREDRPLEFGLIPSSEPNQYYHLNTNRTVLIDEAMFGPEFGYTDTGYRPGRDVYYRFTINNTSVVEVSTDWTATNFNTHLTLIGESGIIAENDNISAPNNLRSQITTTICPGTYWVVVEGLNIWDVGDFGVSVDLLSGGEFDFAAGVSAASCPTATDGVVSISPNNGVAPYSLVWSDGESGSSLVRNDLAPGAYEVTVTDDCDHSLIKSFTITSSADVTPPNASCIDITVNVFEGMDYTVDAALMGANSTDNCGIVAYTASPTTLPAIDNLTFVTISVTDEAGNSDETFCSVRTTLLDGLPGEECLLANSIDNLFGGPGNQPQTSELFSNIGYEADDLLEDNCFPFDNIDASRWFKFTGDGNSYRIAAPVCGGENPMENEDTQIILYGGRCNNPQQLACNDDENSSTLTAVVTVETIVGFTYFILVDGYGGGFNGGGTGNPEGEFCIEVTNLSATSIHYLEELNVGLYPNPAREQVTLDFEGLNTSNTAQITIRDINGRPVWQGVPQGTQMTIATGQFPAGTYVVELRDQGLVGRRRLVIQ